MHMASLQCIFLHKKFTPERNLISAASYKHYDLRLEFHVLNTITVVID